MVSCHQDHPWAYTWKFKDRVLGMHVLKPPLEVPRLAKETPEEWIKRLNRKTHVAADRARALAPGRSVDLQAVGPAIKVRGVGRGWLLCCFRGHIGDA